MGVRKSRRNPNVCKKKGDKVRVIAGKDKEQKLLSLPSKKTKLSLKVSTSLRNTNVQQQASSGGIIRERSNIHVSNVQVLDKNEMWLMVLVTNL